jgi:phage tail-like protein
MNRGAVSGLSSPWPTIASLPGLYQDDELASALTGALDEVLAPALTTIDNIAAYLDPALTPEDFLDWLAGWVGIVLDETWPLERRRALVAAAAQLYRKRGTTAGLAMHLRLFAGGEFEITESGGATWSATAGAAAPGDPSFSVTVRLRPPKKAAVDIARVEALVAAEMPAHVVHRIEIVKERAASGTEA